MPHCDRIHTDVLLYVVLYVVWIAHVPHACKGKLQGPASFLHKVYQRQSSTSALKLGWIDRAEIRAHTWHSAFNFVFFNEYWHDIFLNLSYIFVHHFSSLSCQRTAICHRQVGHWIWQDGLTWKSRCLWTGLIFAIKRWQKFLHR